MGFRGIMFGGSEKEGRGGAYNCLFRREKKKSRKERETAFIYILRSKRGKYTMRALASTRCVLTVQQLSLPDTTLSPQGARPQPVFTKSSAIVRGAYAFKHLFSTEQPHGKAQKTATLVNRKSEHFNRRK